ncbi:MAG: HEAT repeat domain-containing protein [Kiritimatiellaeota bacterium]|nr:HEAT repeat domain-containing protein [Kiritimatiellota bacterium]
MSTDENIPRRSRFPVLRVARLLLLLLLIAAGFAYWQRFAPNPHDLDYNGHRLSYWLHEHPRDYRPVMQALGTNALPFLLAELQITDPAWLRWAEALVRSFEAGPTWDTADVHRYHARLALQILDTNALPALLSAAFARPIRVIDGDLGYEAACALAWLDSSAAKETLQQKIATTLRSLDAVARRNACLVIFAGNLCNTNNVVRQAALLRDPEPTVRAAAVLAARFYTQDESVMLPAVIERLSDEHAIVRQLAAAVLEGRGANAVAALPALKAALVAEPTRPRGADHLDDSLARAPDSAWVCACMQEAIRTSENPAAARK